MAQSYLSLVQANMCSTGAGCCKSAIKCYAVVQGASVLGRGAVGAFLYVLAGRQEGTDQAQKRVSLVVADTSNQPTPAQPDQPVWIFLDLHEQYC